MDKDKKPDVWLIEKKASGQCHDDTTEVLTNNGWKLFKDVDINKDLFFTQDFSVRFGAKGYKTHWQKATHLTDEYYNGEMYNVQLGTNQGCMRVTPNHRIIINDRPGNLKDISPKQPLHKIVYAKQLDTLCSTKLKYSNDPSADLSATSNPDLSATSNPDDPDTKCSVRKNRSAAKYGKYKYNFSKYMYAGKIYCATVPDGTLFTRVIDEGRRGSIPSTPIWSGNSLVQDLRQSGLLVRTYMPTTDKVSRAYAVQPMLESGQVWIPDRKWAHAFAYAMGTFPTGIPSSFDLADTCTQALLYIRNGLYVTHPDDLEHDRPEVRRVSAYGSHSSNELPKEEKPALEDMWGTG